MIFTKLIKSKYFHSAADAASALYSLVSLREEMNKMTLCYIDGKYLPPSGCSVPVTDMAVQRGVAVFESIRIYGGRLFAAREHLGRLAESAERAGISAAEIISKLPGIISGGLGMEGCPADGLVKPYITGGDVNAKGIFPKPRFFVIFDEINKTPEEERRRGAVLEPNRTERPFPLCKSTNYLFGLMPLKGESSKHESLYMPDGEITESMTNNFFLCKEGKIITAPAGRVLDGVTRSAVIELARADGFTVEERCPLESELKEASEAFITGTVNEVLAVTRVGGAVIGDGKPGPISARLYKLFLENLERRLS